MVDQNAWTPPQAGPPYPPQFPMPQPPSSPPPRVPSVVPWILLMVAGVLGMLLALGIIMIPGVLFLLGGGGNVDAFDDFASGFILTSHILGFASLAALILGIVLTVITARKRRRIRDAAMGWHRPR
ncbi:hypothetical protein [Brevibacterium aurantiacum]|uniref:hypothetical protein n=1 Tax=Brevibacterium aurantiacum TaxID=273384 RepID=UPI00108048FA|nr:hypothetical protein [Brevibacterium aurantiacum]